MATVEHYLDRYLDPVTDVLTPDVAQMLRATADLIDPSNERAKEAKRVYKQAIVDSRAFKKLKNDWEAEQDEDILSSDSED